jgi:plastocyanin
VDRGAAPGIGSLDHREEEEKMSMRRRLTLPAIAIVVVLCAAPNASARTKVVVAGGPPPAAAGVSGSVRFDKALDLNGFYRRQITINAGDSVRWLFSRRVVHTVTFLRPGQNRPPLEVPDPAHPYTGFTDATNTPFWFNGQPSLSIPPDHAFPQGGGSTDGRTYTNSGLSAPEFKPYTLKFTRTGTFRYICLVHPGMAGNVKVLAKGRPVPSAREDRAAARAQSARAVQRARDLARFTPAANNVVGGHDRGEVSWFRFFPRTKTVRVGQTVRFSVSSTSEIHTVRFGPDAWHSPADKELIMAQPQPTGPPRLQFNGLIFLPSDPALPPYTGKNHGNGFLNTGVIDTNPNSPPPSSATVTFATPGTFDFECTIHPGMQGTIRVT